MAVDKKISQLASGAPAQAGDEYVVARSGANYKLTLTNIAGNMPATTISSGNLTFSSTGQRITGDMSNATIANRLAFQSSVTNGTTSLIVIPNGTATGAQLNLETDSAIANGVSFQFIASPTLGDTRIQSGIRGTGSYLPMTFYTGGSERMRLDTSGNLGIGTASPGSFYSEARNLVVGTGTGGQGMTIYAGTASQSRLMFADGTTGSDPYTGFVQYDHSSNALAFGTNGGTERMRIDSSGNVGIGTASFSQKLAINSANTSINSLTEYKQGDVTQAYVGMGADNILRIESLARPTGVVAGGANYVFVTTNATERMRIDSSGNVGIGGTAQALTRVDVVGTLPTSSNQSEGIRVIATIPSGSTTGATMFGTWAVTQAASFTLSSLIHFKANQQTLGAGSAITNQYGFYADAALTGATNNYGFYSNIASGSNRWNFYAAGTALNYFAGRTGVGILPTTYTAYGLAVQNTGAGNAAVLFRNDEAATTTSLFWNAGTSGDNLFAQFGTDGGATVRGSIDYNRAGGAVRYNTTSDYRAKDVYGAWDDAGATIDALKVYRGKMHGATLERPMMIAHEAQAVVPYAVSGEKDAVDKNGKPVYQQMDHQVLVPLLIAELQAVRARLAALEAK